MIQRFAALVAVLMLSGVTTVLATEWKNVPLVDKMCLDKVRSDPDRHEKSCLLSCAHSGYGILTADGTWLRFDEAGNQKAVAALKATDKQDHVRVTVTGDLKGDSIDVKELTIE